MSPILAESVAISDIEALLSEAEDKAWEALSGYKFWMFGYHAAKWVQLNQLLPRAQRWSNPFIEAVRLARAKLEAPE